MQKNVKGISFFHPLLKGLVKSVLVYGLAFTGFAIIATSAQAGTSPPAVEAGDPQTVNAGSIVTLQGSADPVEYVWNMNYVWTQLTGTVVTFLDAASGVVNISPPGENSPSQDLVVLPAVTFTAPASAGVLTFQLAADPDYTPATGYDTVTVTVVAPPSPEDAIAILIVDVQAFSDSSTLNGGQVIGLTSKLDGALVKLASGSTQPSINKLQSFINQMQALINGGTLTTEEGQPLLDAAMAIIAQLDA